MSLLSHQAFLLFVSNLVALIITLSCNHELRQSQAPARANPNTSSSVRQSDGSDGWHSPAFHGLTTGKSTKADVRRVFGQPLWEGAAENEELDGGEAQLLYEYIDVGGMRGRTSIYFNARTGVIESISLYPQQLFLKHILAKYGSDYFERASKLGPCPTAEEIHDFRPPKEREYPYFIVYPQRGMFVSIQEDGAVLEIGYRSHCP